jgi:hypothetical protein
LDLEQTWEESEPRTPLVCILSVGSDPTNQIIALAKLKNIREHEELSLEIDILFKKYSFFFSNKSRFNGSRTRVSCTQNDDGVYGNRLIIISINEKFPQKFLISKYLIFSLQADGCFYRTFICR